MKIKFAKIFATVWSEGPKIYFWWSILGLGSLSIKFKNLYYYWPAVIIASISLLFIFKKMYSSLKRDIQESLINRVTEQTVSNSVDLAKNLRNHLPPRGFFDAIYDYSDSLARDWATDGTVCNVNFYIECNSSKISKTAQIFIYSAIKKEQLMKLLPLNSETIEILETEPLEIKMTRISNIKNINTIIETAIDSATSEICKSDNVRMQIAPVSDSISINFYLNKNSRQWSKRFKYKCGSLYDMNNNILKKFEK